MKRRLMLATFAVAVSLAAVVSTGGAGAAPSHAMLDLSSVAAVKQYLRLHGVSTAGLVVQHGTRNYAGPRCPGRGWTCTSARRVLQVAKADSNGQNTFECSPSYGTPAQPSFFPSAPSGSVACTIVQVSTSGNNSGRCVIHSTLDPVTEYCAIHQENATGNNDAFVDQVVRQTNDTQQQMAAQQAYVEQYDGTGSNSLQSGQLIDQSSTVSGTVDQQQTPSIFLSVLQNADSGRNSAHADQTVQDDQTANGANASGSQSQNSDLTGEVFQNSVDVSSSTVRQHEDLDQSAPKGAPVDQFQHGPLFCCETQGSNTGDHANLDQSSVLSATSPFASQDTSIVGHCDSTGSCDVRETGKMNADSQTNTCTGSFCEIGIECFAAGEGPGFCQPTTPGDSLRLSPTFGRSS